ncbi:MAG: HEAT repeat domain-containing protein [Planctomycetes bacterium]|nr:HEAT repeat domain-containing protein [Planctomycetota bacterium]MBL7039847.1 HEAT repeat domain-containing protein [Pirellulaceae bacterium]
MLPSADLKPAYDKIVWLYVYRDFSKSEADLKAERISLRFGLTSWPQLILVDPESLRVLRQTGRTVTSFLAAVDSAEVKTRESSTAVDRVKQADARAIQLESDSSVALAKQYLDDEDIVVRYRALSILAEQDPESVAARAEPLLQVRNDPFRYEVCKVLSKTENAAANSALESLVRRPAYSNNPNVLRSRAVAALAACGDVDSVDAIRPFAKGSYLNMLTRTAVDSLAAIASRHPEARDRVRQILIEAYPAPPPEPSQTHFRYCLSLARRVHSALEKITGESRAFPDVYDSAARDKLMQSWQE